MNVKLLAHDKITYNRCLLLSSVYTTMSQASLQSSAYLPNE